MVMANRLNIVVINKLEKKVSDRCSNIARFSKVKMNAHTELEKYQGSREQFKKMWKVKATVVLSRRSQQRTQD